MDSIDKPTQKIIIGTPTYDGKLQVWYTLSLVNTIKLSQKYNVEIMPVWLSYDALIQRARNDLVKIALKHNADALIWIDSDISWDPEWFFKLVKSKHDVIGGTYPKKGEDELYVFKQTTKKSINPITNLLEVEGLGTGFVKMSKKALQYLWDTSPSYIDPKDNQESRMVSNVIINNNSLMSEDIMMFMNLQKGGFKIYLDTTMTCEHTGTKKWSGDFVKWYNKITKSDKQL